MPAMSEPDRAPSRRTFTALVIAEAVALTAGAEQRGDERRPLRIFDVVDVDPAEVPDEQVRAAEAEIGIGEVEARERWRRRCRLVLGFLLRFGLVVLLFLRTRGHAARRGGIEEAGRLR